ncbi:hypothetical protein [Methylobacterium durans]|uniref:Secreted protein n=1 Tax=Methylobacterium durans TaxID=2202825 RepID=A0A2U8W8V5_9HYPH|nr:hypothetical protein [Methylobacterium durans]AWN42564.1 hypothetical protein DK389_21225 [Methylobacterium durans]
MGEALRLFLIAGASVVLVAASGLAQTFEVGPDDVRPGHDHHHEPVIEGHHDHPVIEHRRHDVDHDHGVVIERHDGGHHHDDD